jgi:histidinol phosphatase-like PHP family hydrolase
MMATFILPKFRCSFLESVHNVLVLLASLAPLLCMCYSQGRDMLFDFHTHTILSDGTLSPLELVRRALVNGYSAVAITDHVGMGYLERLVGEIATDCSIARSHWDITAIPGVELTHVPKKAIAECAKRAKEAGAVLVVVHGETPAEPVEPGTNLAAVQSPHVDILSHPGFITLEEAKLAAENDICLEITTRRQHATTNRHVAEMARLAGANLVVNSDAHDVADLLTPELALAAAKTAGLTDDEAETVIKVNPVALLERVRAR